ncbi:Uu.00g046500.m01.CDS01 [Anthostomella pinea]|uniref:Uu.00g046500.m01.CDS01 n=1 Tax=Anthostomella pinea TaxID=933095 RepID=A0AAI8YEI5_9PEZI|nr:Uu.00g046500.m01.CDS01 [Anthostomella pinea]
MPPRTSLLDFGTRNFVCRSCRSNLQKRSPVAQWPIRLSSHAAEAHAPAPSNQPSAERDAERIKTLETLGLLNDSPKVSVNYFEQDKHGRLRRLEDKDEFGESMTDPGGEIGLQLRALQQQLEHATGLVRTIEELGGKDEAEKLQRQFALGEDQEFIELATESGKQSTTTSPFIPQEELGTATPLVRRLNNSIRSCVKHGDAVFPNLIVLLWKHYSSARKFLYTRWKGSYRLHTVPRPTWDLLWRVLTADQEFNTNRMTHAYVLAKDMVRAGVSLSDKQQLLAIEAMFIQGHGDEAVQNHRRFVATLGAKQETFIDFWQLGLRMHCLTGDMVRAKQMVDVILKSPYKKDPRFVLPFIRLCAETPGEVGNGFSAYRHMRDALQDSITIEDYDLVISYFLASDNTDYALYAFVDMMKAGSIDLSRAPTYPASIANSYFFGKWLKRLIGAGDLNGAHSVLLFMRTKGIVPQAIQVNGLIGAWLRSPTADSVQKAENVAWAMINTRIQFVELRRRRSDIEAIQLEQSGDGWPRATPETFSLLAECYKTRGKPVKMNELWQAFREADIALDSFMLNQVLQSYLQDGKGQLVEITYRTLAKQYDIKPDPWTFTALWQALPVNRLSRILSTQYVGEGLRARALFREMMGQVAIFMTDGATTIDTFLARNILHSFHKVNDKAGLLLAYRALRKVFNFEPPAFVVMELLVGSSDLEKTAKGRDAARLIQAQARLEDFLKQRHDVLIESGELNADDDLPPEVKDEETSKYLELHLVEAVVALKHHDPQSQLTNAAQAMGLVDDDEHEGTEVAQV